MLEGDHHSEPGYVQRCLREFKILSEEEDRAFERFLIQPNFKTGIDSALMIAKAALLSFGTVIEETKRSVEMLLRKKS